MVSQSAEYALRAVICLARQPAVSLTGQQIARGSQVPARYLAKVLQTLVRKGIITSQRGSKGGFVLKRDPAALTLLEVVHAVDASRRLCQCPLGLHGDHLCTLHRRIDEAAAKAEEHLCTMTVAAAVEGTPLAGECREGPQGLAVSLPQAQ